MHPPGPTGRQRQYVVRMSARPSIRSFVRYQTSKHSVLNYDGLYKSNRRNCRGCLLLSRSLFRPPVCGGPRRPTVSSLGINEHTRRACDAPVNSRRPRVPGGRGSRVEQSAGRCHFVAITVDIQETAEDRTVCSEVSIVPAASDTLLFTARAARTSFHFSSFFVL